MSYLLSRLSIDFGKFVAYGYLGVFLASLIGSATLFFPVPHIVTVFAAGMLFDPIGVAIAAGVGGAIGEVTGYLVGLGSHTLGKESKWYPRVSGMVHRHGGIVIFLFALIPNPFFDLAGIAAGASRYPVIKFFLVTLGGRVLRSLFLAYSGSQVG